MRHYFRFDWMAQQIRVSWFGWKVWIWEIWVICLFLTQRNSTKYSNLSKLVSDIGPHHIIYNSCFYILEMLPFGSESIFLQSHILSKVFKFGWWMGQYGGQSPKRHQGFSNNPWSANLDLGVYRREQQAKQTRIQTVRRYQKKDGARGYCGTKSLKQTQSGPYQVVYIYDLIRFSYTKNFQNFQMIAFLSAIFVVI